MRLVPCCTASTASGTSGPRPADTTLIRLGSHLVMNVKLDRSQHSGALKGIDIDTTVPNFLISIDIHSAKSLCVIIGAYLATVAAESAPKPGNNTTAAQDKNGPLSKSIMQNVLMSDPTLRTLFWLEEQENLKKKAGKSGASGAAAVEMLKKGDGGAGDGSDIDFARIAQLMRQVRALIDVAVAATVAIGVDVEYISSSESARLMVVKLFNVPLPLTLKYLVLLTCSAVPHHP